mmetsp:Transcript_176437/g.565735  ORF Transcript_176437/g.565735 Transcript_176437/m.565735 type:complete len:372 (-) Transcript_176437:203-1318(-)
MSATSRTSWLRARRSHFLSSSAALRKRRCSIVMQSRLFGMVVPLLLGGAPTSESSWLSSSSSELQELEELLLQLLPESSLQSEPALQLRPPGKEKRPAPRQHAESGPRADPGAESTWKLLQPVLTGDFPPAEHNAFLAAAPLTAAAAAAAALGLVTGGLPGLGFAALKVPPAVKTPAQAVKPPPAVKAPLAVKTPAAAEKAPPAVKKPPAVKAPPAAKKPATSYALFMKEMSKTMEKGLSVGERAKIVAGMWAAAGDKGKKKYEDEAASLRKAYDDEQPPAPPKKPLAGFMIFGGDMRAGIMKANPDFVIADVGKKLGEMWKALSEADKTAYSKKAAEAKKVYEKAYAAFIKEHGEPLKKEKKTKKVKVTV